MTVGNRRRNTIIGGRFQEEYIFSFLPEKRRIQIIKLF